MFKKKNITDTKKSDWKESGSFMKKPERGWLHPDHSFDSGVSYGAKYVGCIKILQSMRTISYDDRGQLVREAIAKCCDKAKMIKHKKKKAPQDVQKILGDIFVGYCGEDVTVSISKSSIKVTLTRTGVLICDHDMTNISFASAGEKEYAQQFAYVAKDTVFERACFVMECEHGLTADLIHTIGQAFELKYKDFLNKTPQATEVPEKFSQPIFGDQTQATYTAIQKSETIESANRYQSYKLNPDHTNYSEINQDQVSYSQLNQDQVSYSQLNQDQVSYSQLNQDQASYSQLNQNWDQASYSQLNQDNANYSHLNRGQAAGSNQGVTHYDKLKQFPPPLDFAAGAGYSEPKKQSEFAAVYDNPIASPTAREQLGIETRSNNVESIYDNPQKILEEAAAARPPAAISAAHGPAAGWTQFDDGQDSDENGQDSHGYLVPAPRSSIKGPNISQHGSISSSQDSADDYQTPTPSMYDAPSSPPAVDKSNPLYKQGWFHGPISRVEAEMVIEHDGDYIVRESSNIPEQYVLSGMQNGQYRHLLLVDPQGQVRTKDRTFNSVEELITFHTSNSIPIISGGSDVYLKRSISRHKNLLEPTGNPTGNSFKI